MDEWAARALKPSHPAADGLGAPQRGRSRYERNRVVTSSHRPVRPRLRAVAPTSGTIVPLAGLPSSCSSELPSASERPLAGVPSCHHSAGLSPFTLSLTFRAWVTSSSTSYNTSVSSNPGYCDDGC
jgi:hypothetical protein